MIRVLLADDHTIVREGLRALLAEESDFEVVGEASDGREAVALAEELAPDVVVMDLAMPKLNGVDATARIRKACPDTQVVVLSMHATAAHVRPALRAGARGYLVKGSGLGDLRKAVEAVARGEAFFSPAVAAIVLDADGGADEARLTSREREVLQLVGEGRSSPEIARALGISVKTIEGHRSRLMGKLGVSNVAGLVRSAVRLGLVQV
ncbi:MAG TPA: response regulator transcription factor [Polyangiaceae bacterium LLY-WYZ-15_(1-7)]|nr:DNA-binding response regulator [Myxococcales bacterium]MAT26066.1 DNA-binding response regulator [Sandaracinus sp.]HJK95195.1 response regulator transcription factor [Polyangiaceae bacterium LLY-WYZ-15_(1-7)]MBJ70815.1 DNA-binding response regulator [Sandaracinus sp.]HJL00810.1 response regulator transcription factor [Polyangiaceae bacterium LLY-WYZ-15_(1-7)]